MRVVVSNKKCRDLAKHYPSHTLIPPCRPVDHKFRTSQLPRDRPYPCNSQRLEGLPHASRHRAHRTFCLRSNGARGQLRTRIPEQPGVWRSSQVPGVEPAQEALSDFQQHLARLLHRVLCYSACTRTSPSSKSAQSCTVSPCAGYEGRALGLLLGFGSSLLPMKLSRRRQTPSCGGGEISFFCGL